VTLVKKWKNERRSKNIDIMGLSRVASPDSLFKSHKKVTLLPTRKKNFNEPSAGKPFISIVSQDKANWHLICM
jgi:hypothetical protein